MFLIPLQVGTKVGRLTLQEKFRKHDRTYWRALCVCKKVHEARADHLARQKILSCGCGHDAQGHAAAQSPTYNTWRAMVNRCYNKKYSAYPHYGGAGITVCNEWRHSFLTFLQDMGERPDGTTLDREDWEGNYEPGNCTWKTSTEQALNRSSTHWIIWRGYRHCLSQWSKLLGCDPRTLKRRITKYGEQEALDGHATTLLAKLALCPTSPPSPLSSPSTTTGATRLTASIPF